MRGRRAGWPRGSSRSYLVVGFGGGGGVELSRWNIPAEDWGSTGGLAEPRNGPSSGVTQATPCSRTLQHSVTPTLARSLPEASPWLREENTQVSLLWLQVPLHGCRGEMSLFRRVSVSVGGSVHTYASKAIPWT